MTHEVGDLRARGDVVERNDLGVACSGEEGTTRREFDGSDGRDQTWSLSARQ